MTRFWGSRVPSHSYVGKHAALCLPPGVPYESTDTDPAWPVNNYIGGEYRLALVSRKKAAARPAPTRSYLSDLSDAALPCVPGLAITEGLRNHSAMCTLRLAGDNILFRVPPKAGPNAQPSDEKFTLDVPPEHMPGEGEEGVCRAGRGGVVQGGAGRDGARCNQ